MMTKYYFTNGTYLLLEKQNVVFTFLHYVSLYRHKKPFTAAFYDSDDCPDNF